jgi:hypothetical protein
MSEVKIAALGLHPRGDMVATQIEDANRPRLEGVYLIDFPRKTGAGEGIRTLDPNLGKIGDILF